jgi:regulatory protein
MELSQRQREAYDKAAFLCSRGEKCSSDVREKLKQWGYSSEESKAVVEKLVAEKYIDDERFARAYAKDKFRFNGWGKQKIEYMLRSKHISSEIMVIAFEEIETENYDEKLRLLLAEKIKSVKGNDQFEQKNKLARFAMGRGFEPDVIFRILKELKI